jgi:hypothetical protein
LNRNQVSCTTLRWSLSSREPQTLCAALSAMMSRAEPMAHSTARRICASLVAEAFAAMAHAGRRIRRRSRLPVGSPPAAPHDAGRRSISRAIDLTRSHSLHDVVRPLEIHSETISQRRLSTPPAHTLTCFPACSFTMPSRQRQRFSRSSDMVSRGPILRT